MPLDFGLTTSASVFAVFGLIALGMTLLPRILHQRPLSFPILYMGAGWALASLPLGLPLVDPLAQTEATLRLTEVGVIVALFGVGLKIGRPLSWRKWRSTWGLLGLTMPLTIGLAAGLAAWVLGFDPASAVLFGAVLAPTDPVLASDVQQPSPGEDDTGDEDNDGGEVRFALTSEAGLNDALAFPFTMAAIAMVERGANPAGWVGTWFGVDVVYRLVVGLAVGVAAGRVLRLIVFRIPVRERRLAETGEGLVALAGTFLTYGVAELAEGYGFLAVFVAAYALRASSREHDYHAVVHDFAEQIERLLTGVVLVLFGAAIADGLLRSVTWQMIVVAVVLLFLVRPITGLAGLPRATRGRWIIAFFGIRGVGSFFYLAYALADHEFAQAEQLWAAVGLVVALSVVIHGLTAGPVMRRHDPPPSGDGDDAPNGPPKEQPAPS